MRLTWIAWTPLLALLAGCDALKADTTTLWSTSSAPVMRPRCDACHGFAPRTGAHRYHLDSTRTVAFDQHITCMDCHSASIAFSKTRVVDSIFYNDDPMILSNHTASFPWKTFLHTEMFDTLSFDSVPMTWSKREAGAENPFWITADAKGPGMPGHANGSVDVVFAERNAYATDDSGIAHKATWNPVRLSCNAVACHGSNAFDTIKYVWKDVVKAAP